MKTYFLTTVIFLSVFYVSLFSQTNDENNSRENRKYKFSLGAGVGFTTGYGASFRYTPNKFGVQVNFSPLYNKSPTFDEATLQISAGITFLYSLIEAENTCFYLYQGNHFNHYYNPSAINNLYENNETKYNRLNNGIGVGVQFIILKRVGIDIMGGYAFYDNFERHTFTGEAGLYYKF